jgi:hypothetical protein
MRAEKAMRTCRTAGRVGGRLSGVMLCAGIESLVYVDCVCVYVRAFGCMHTREGLEAAVSGIMASAHIACNVSSARRQCQPYKTV